MWVDYYVGTEYRIVSVSGESTAGASRLSSLAAYHKVVTDNKLVCHNSVSLFVPLKCVLPSAQSLCCVLRIQYCALREKDTRLWLGA